MSIVSVAYPTFVSPNMVKRIEVLCCSTLYRLARIAAMQPVDNSAACARMQAWRLASS
jgi:hypothetical protein